MRLPALIRSMQYEASCSQQEYAAEVFPPSVLSLLSSAGL
jgi:hypothetical protein